MQGNARLGHWEHFEPPLSHPAAYHQRVTKQSAHVATRRGRAGMFKNKQANSSSRSSAMQLQPALPAAGWTCGAPLIRAPDGVRTIGTMPVVKRAMRI